MTVATAIFGDRVVAASMIDRIVRHSDVLTLKGSGCRLKNSGIGIWRKTGGVRRKTHSGN